MFDVLTERRFSWGRRCRKMQWLRMRYEEVDRPESRLAARARGSRYRRTAQAARAQIGPGRLINVQSLSPQDALLATQQAIDEGVPRIYQAMFEHAQVRVTVDVLERGEGGYVLCGFRTATRIKPAYLDGLGFKTQVVEGSGLRVVEIQLMHLRRKAQPLLFRRADVTTRVRARMPGLAAEAVEQLAQIHGPMPAVEMDKHCIRPYRCSHLQRCGGEARAVPSSPPGPQRATVDPVRLSASLAPLRGRIAFLDFESVSAAIPPLPGMAPFERFPVQFSCHVLEPGGFLVHHESLPAELGVDPRPALGEDLLQACSGMDHVLVYSAAAERQALRSLARILPARAEEFRSIEQRLFDLWPIMRRHVRHPGFHGSYGLKSVVPVLVGASMWGQEQVQDGYTAGLLLEAMLFDEQAFEDNEREDLRKAMLGYCRIDTLALVELLGALRQLAKGPITGATTPQVQNRSES